MHLVYLILKLLITCVHLLSLVWHKARSAEYLKRIKLSNKVLLNLLTITPCKLPKVQFRLWLKATGMEYLVRIEFTI